MPPGPRAGFSMCVHKKRALLFGGVVDMEVGGQFLSSSFFFKLTKWVLIFSCQLLTICRDQRF